MTYDILNFIGIALLGFHFSSIFFADKIVDWLKKHD